MWRSCCQNMPQSKWMRPRLAKTTSASTMRSASQTMALRLFMGLASCGASRLVGTGGEGCACGTLAVVELADDAGDVGAGLGIGRDTVVAVDGGGAGVVCGGCGSHVVAIAGEELIEIGGAAADVDRKSTRL